MSDSKLRDAILAIRSQLAQADTLPEDRRRSLEALLQDLERLPDAPAATAAADAPTVRERLDDAVRHLEASHPTLSTTLGSVVDTLALFGL